MSPPIDNESGSTRQCPTVLVVDDFDLLRELIRHLLASADVQVLEASSGAEALAVAAACEQPPRVLITDMHLPDCSCIELAAQLRLRWPGLKTLVISSDPSGDLVARAIPEAKFLEKTLLADRLVQRVRELLGTASQ